MSGLQRSAVSFRRQGSSGLVWEDRFLSGDLNEMKKRMEKEQGGDKRALRASKSVSSAAAAGSGTGLSRNKSISPGGSAWRASKISPAIDPPSPKLQGCALCGFFGSKTTKRSKPRRKR